VLAVVLAAALKHFCGPLGKARASSSRTA